jgi:hypothetical protein
MVEQQPERQAILLKSWYTMYAVLTAGQPPARSVSPTKPAGNAAVAAASAAAAAAAASALAASQAGGSSQAADVAAVPLAADIRAVIDTAKQEVEAAAKAYYAAKVSSEHRCV